MSARWSSLWESHGRPTSIGLDEWPALALRKSIVMQAVFVSEFGDRLTGACVSAPR
jgi:hypothetical protein